MILSFIKNIKTLPLSNKSMIYLMWIYRIGGIVGNIFINIYIYKLNESILQVIIYNSIFFVSIFLGAGIIGFITPFLKLNIRNLYYFSYLFFTSAFFLLFIGSSILFITYIFAFLYGTATGLFWCAVHTQELVNIKDKNRDFYASSIAAGNNIIMILVPFCISFIFFLAPYFQLNGYTILFNILPFIYVISFFFIKNIKDYYPKKVKKEDIKHIFNLKKHFFGLLYFFLTGCNQVLFIFIPIIAILLLKNEINIGLFEGTISLTSAILIIIINHFRSTNNRLKLMGIFGLLLSLNYIIFIFNFHLIGYIIFSFVILLLRPIYRTSEHIYDLKLMDTIKAPGSDFFSTMVIREGILFIGRAIIFIILFIGIQYPHFSLEIFLKVVLFGISIIFMINWMIIYLHLKYETNKIKIGK